MTSPVTSPASTHSETAVWESLRQAIVESSGFKRWLNGRSCPTSPTELDHVVHQYLEQTLSTLAY
ncbi:MAG: hypothetical protein HC818_08035 [Synechococcaceae cyanobacterium RM1_1_27]|nr:hypothetical protein [Synechococcaceae cyanobacterium SM2_3_2]NJO86454.1 hypothetical protein [Synechococcaceae cyanobacterium RM1_1_27]